MRSGIFLLTAAISFAQVAQLPRYVVDTSMPTQTGATVIVAGDCSDFQSRIDSASLGDTIAIPAGTLCRGHYRLRKKTTGKGWIIIRTAAPDSSLPAPGNRINPSWVAQMPRIISPDANAAIDCDDGAHHYRLIGLYLSYDSKAGESYHIVSLGPARATATASNLPDHIVIDRCYIHGSDNVNCKRGVSLNSKASAVIDSYIDAFYHEYLDSQAIWGGAGPGPYKIVNNYLDGGTENILFGGIAPGAFTPEDIEVRGNLIVKPIARRTALSANNKPWLVKNLFELKVGHYVLVYGNVLQNSWYSAGGQTGEAFLFQGIDGPTVQIHDVTLAYNFTEHASAGILNCGDCIGTSQTRDPALPNYADPSLYHVYKVYIHDNIFDDMSWKHYGNVGAANQGVAFGAEAVSMFTFDHNTYLTDPSQEWTGADGMIVIDALVGNHCPGANEVFPQSGVFHVTNNIMSYGTNGVQSFACIGGQTTVFAHYTTNSIFKGNIVQGATPEQQALFDSGNFYPKTMEAVRFTNYHNAAGGDYSLSGASPYKRRGTDGKDIGADAALVDRITACVTAGTCGTEPTPLVGVPAI